jgi:hypothetical protein
VPAFRQPRVNIIRRNRFEIGAERIHFVTVSPPGLPRPFKRRRTGTSHLVPATQ